MICKSSTSKTSVEQGGITSPKPHLTISHSGGHNQHAVLSDVHAGYALVPTLDDLADPQCKVESSVAVQ